MVSWLNLVQSNLSQQFFLDLGKRFRQRSCTPVECFRGPGGKGGGGGARLPWGEGGAAWKHGRGIFPGDCEKVQTESQRNVTWESILFGGLCCESKRGQQGGYLKNADEGRMGLWGGGAVINIRRLPSSRPGSNLDHLLPTSTGSLGSPVTQTEVFHVREKSCKAGLGFGLVRKLNCNCFVTASQQRDVWPFPLKC